MKVLIVGGTGITGKLVREFLASTGWQIDFCSRHADPDPHHRMLDLSGSKRKTLALLREYDWVVACIGPFEKWLDQVAGLCVDAGTNYLDVNDSVEAREAILKVPAQNAGITVMTGAGLCPGLSTALLMGEAGQSVKDIRVELRIGKGQPSGAASVLSMFSTIYSGYRVLQNGIVETIPHPDTPGELIGYECPDMGSVSGLFPGVQNYSYHVGFAALSAETIRALQKKRVFSLPVVSGWLAKKASAGVTRKALEANDPQPASLTVRMLTDQSKTTAVLTGLTSYQFTALSAAACLRELVSKPLTPGVYEVARLPRLCDPLLDACREHGARISVLREEL